MNTGAPSASSNHRVPVRWPFRLLAAVVVVAGIVATIGLVLSGWHQGAVTMRWQFLASLPGVAWFVRLCWYAAIRGRSSGQEWWPFASQRVFICYVIVWSLAMYA